MRSSGWTGEQASRFESTVKEWSDLPDVGSIEQAADAIDGADGISFQTTAGPLKQYRSGIVAVSAFARMSSGECDPSSANVSSSQYSMFLVVIVISTVGLCIVHHYLWKPGKTT
jgi:hypothetical protein